MWRETVAVGVLVALLWALGARPEEEQSLIFALLPEEGSRDYDSTSLPPWSEKEEKEEKEKEKEEISL